MDPLILYIYDSTMVISCVDLYNPQKLSIVNYVCNGEINKKHEDGLHKAVDPVNMNNTHLVWDFKKWNSYLIEQGVVNSTEWWQEELIPMIERKVHYFFRMNMPEVPSDPRVVGIVAFDAAFNRKGELFLFDCNVTPNIKPFTQGNV